MIFLARWALIVLAITYRKVLYASILFSLVRLDIGMLPPAVSSISPASVSRCVVSKGPYIEELGPAWKKPFIIELNQPSFLVSVSDCFGLESYLETEFTILLEDGAKGSFPTEALLRLFLGPSYLEG